MKKKNVKLKSRRSFVKSGLALSAITILPRHVLGGKGFIAPSDQLKLLPLDRAVRGQVTFQMRLAMVMLE